MKDDDHDSFIKRFDNAEKRKEHYNDLIDECYEYALPLRERTYSSGDPLPSMENLYDSTALSDTQSLASQMLDDIWPTDSKPFVFEAGRLVDEAVKSELNRSLVDVSDEIIETMNNSNFRSAMHETLMDWSIGEGFLLTEPGDAVDPVNFRSLPLTEAFPNIGPRGETDFLGRKVKCKASDAKFRYPKGQFSAEFKLWANSNGDTEVTFKEGWYRDWERKDNEVWQWRVALCYDATNKNELIEKSQVEGIGSKPFADFSFTRVAGELLGRGPVMLALPDIKTLNLVKQFVLENADLAIGGMWLAEDDGVMNVDNITIESRTIIPVGRNSNGLRRIEAAGDFNVADLVISDLQNAIHQVMLGDDLGLPEGTPMSATEVLQRSSNTARRRAGPYTRLLKDVGVVIRRVAYLLKKQNRIRLPAIDGRTIMLRPLSPLTRAQAQDEILRHDRYMEMLQVRLGPQQAAMVVKGDKYAEWLADKMGVDPNVIRNQVEREQMAQVIAAMAEQQMGGEGAPV